MDVLDLRFSPEQDALRADGPLGPPPIVEGFAEDALAIADRLGELSSKNNELCFGWLLPLGSACA